VIARAASPLRGYAALAPPIAQIAHNVENAAADFMPDLIHETTHF
jgi:hypothetical protein